MSHPLTNPDLTLFVDGSYYRNGKENFQVGYATTHNTIYWKREIFDKLNHPNKQSYMPLSKHSSYQKDKL